MIEALIDAVSNADIAEPFTIKRSTGSFAAGGWQSSNTALPAYGVVSVAQDTYLEMVPEADRVHGARVFVSTTPMYVTSDERLDQTAGTSDILIWNIQKYRVHSVGNYINRGFYYAVATRMRGA